MSIQKKRWKRHETYGHNIPALDVDAVEFDSMTPIALFEYKCEFEDGEPDPSKVQYLVLHRLAEMADLPFFWVQYQTDYSSFYITPCNYRAELLGEGFMYMECPERMFVQFLYHIRHREVPDEILRRFD